MKDVEFHEANRVYEAQCVELAEEARISENRTQTSNCRQGHREIVSMRYLQS